MSPQPTTPPPPLQSVSLSLSLSLSLQFARVYTLTEDDVAGRVVEILEDMGHDMNLKVARVLLFSLSFLAKRIFTTIEVNLDGIEKVHYKTLS